MTPLEHAEQIKRLADEYAMTQADPQTHFEQGEQSYGALRAAIDSLAQRCAAAEAKLAEVEADARRLDFIKKRARCDPKMDGQHVWWPTNFNHALKGPTLRAAIDQAMESKHG